MKVWPEFIMEERSNKNKHTTTKNSNRIRRTYLFHTFSLSSQYFFFCRFVEIVIIFSNNTPQRKAPKVLSLEKAKNLFIYFFFTRNWRRDCRKIPRYSREFSLYALFFQSRSLSDWTLSREISSNFFRVYILFFLI